jgi:hypothetical protein
VPIINVTDNVRPSFGIQKSSGKGIAAKVHGRTQMILVSL